MAGEKTGRETWAIRLHKLLILAHQGLGLTGKAPSREEAATALDELLDKPRTKTSGTKAGAHGKGKKV
jgi:hypothetical protein